MNSILGRLGALGLIALGGGSCRTFTKPAVTEEIEPTKAYWMHYDATRRGGIVLPADKKVFLCAEPSPDVAMGVTAELLAKVNYEGAGGELQGKLAEQIVELGKRTQTVMFLRESMYRLCEISNNHPEELKGKLTELYGKVLDTALKVADAELESSKARVQEADNRRTFLQQLKDLPAQERIQALLR